MESIEKIVDFQSYCPKCKYAESSAAEDPCNECLTKPVNLYSKKPIKWKAASGYEKFVAPETNETDEKK